MKSLGDGKFTIVIKDTSKCVDVPSNDNFTKIREFDCIDNSANQIFTFRAHDEYSVPSQIPLNSWTQLINNQNGLCLKFVALNYWITQAPCAESNEFLWNVSWNSWDNTYAIASKTGNVLFDNYANLQHNGNIIHSWSRHGWIQESMILEVQGDGTFLIKFKGSPSCARVQNDAVGTPLVQWTCEGTYTRQYWKFNPIQSNINQDPLGLSYNQWFRIKNVESGRCVKANLPETQMLNVDCMNTINYRWSFSWNTWDNTFFIVNGLDEGRPTGVLFDNYANLLHNGNASFSAAKHGGPQQHWIVRKVGDYYQFIPKASNKCMQLANGNTDNYSGYVQWDCNENNRSQLFSLEVVPTTFTPVNFVDNWVQIVNKE